MIYRLVGHLSYLLMHYNWSVILLSDRSAAKAAKHSTQVYSESKASGGPSSATKQRPSSQPYVDYFDMTDWSAFGSDIASPIMVQVKVPFQFVLVSARFIAVSGRDLSTGF